MKIALCRSYQFTSLITNLSPNDQSCQTCTHIPTQTIVLQSISCLFPFLPRHMQLRKLNRDTVKKAHLLQYSLEKHMAMCEKMLGLLEPELSQEKQDGYIKCQLIWWIGPQSGDCLPLSYVLGKVP